ncbi:MAG: hypothetical protein NXI27_15560 [Alphaproteobacteria bacterium]|nr:hypothetical protein [Alphaproteobacteria bacterium]
MTLLQKTMRLLRQRIEAVPGSYYAHRHPGPVARKVISALSPLIVHLTPNDKWSLGAHLPYWLAALDVPAIKPLPEPKRVFMFCAYRIQFTLDFTVAILLAWRGHTVTIGYLPKLQSPIKSPLIDDPSAKPYLAAVLAQVESWSRGRIRCVDLSDFPVAKHDVDAKALREQVLSDIIMCTRRETIDRDDPEVATAWDYYESQARQSHALAMSYLTRHKSDYDLVLLANGTTFEPAQFCQSARRLGIPVNTFEKFDFKQIRVMNHGDHFLAFDDLDAVWQARKELGYMDDPFYSFAVESALGLLDERRRASTAHWGLALQKSPNQPMQDTLRTAGVDDGRRFVLVCTNVPYDAGYAILLGLFPSMRAWLLATVQYLLDETDIHVVVRAHPGEAAHYGGKERSEDILAGVLGHERLTVISGQETANTYNLIEKCHFGVVFSSTTGVEMAMLGKTALVGATVYYGRRGFTVDSDYQEAYFNQLSRLAGLEDAPLLGRDESGQAALFHFIFHRVMLWPYPYDKPSGVRARPPQDLLSSADIGRYISFIDALCCERDEWVTRLGEFLTPDGSNHIPVPPNGSPTSI